MSSNDWRKLAYYEPSGSLKLSHITTPSSPSNGELWTTTSGLYARINGVTVGPFESAAGSYQPASADLTAIDALAGTSGFLKKTATDTWALDTNTYLTGNQSITVSGDATGSGTTSIALTLANSGVSAGTYNNNAAQVRPFTVDAKGRVTSIGAAVNIAIAQSAVTNLTTDLGNKQPLDADLTAIAALAGTSGFLKKTAADTWALDTSTYLTGNQTITLSGAVTGSGTTSISTTLSNLDASKVTTGTFNIARIPTGTTGSTVALGNHTHSYLALSGGTLTGKLTTAASAAGGAGISLPHGTAPTSPSNGDVWTTTAGLYARINGSTIGPFGVSTGATWGGITGTLSSQTDLQSALNAKQNSDADLTAIAALAGTSGLLRKTAADTWSLDTASYLTSNQTITISGAVTGSGTTSISTTLSNLDAAKVTTGVFDIARIPTGSTGSTVSLGNHTHSYQPVDADLTAIAALAGTSGLLRKTAADTWTLDTTAYTTNTGTVTSVAMTVPTGLSVSGSPITGSGTLAVSLATGYSIPTTASQANWDTAYTDRNKWDGGSSGLTASTGRTSLGGTTVGQNLFTLTNPSAITFIRVNADNTVSALDAGTFRSAIGAGTGDVVGPASSTDNAIVRFDSTTGKLVQDSNIIIEDTGHLITPANITLTRQWPIIAMDGVNGKHGAIVFQSDASNRWDIGPTDNSAQDLKIVRRDDSGTWLDQPMTIRRSDGQTTFRSTITDGLVARGATHGSVVALGETGDAIGWLQAESASGNYAYNKLRTRWGQAGQNELHTGLSYDGSWFVSPKIVNGSSVSRDNTIHIASDGTINFNPATGYVNINGVNMHLRNQNSAADLEIRSDYNSVYQVYKPSYNSGTGVTWIEFWKGSQRYWGNNATSTDFKWDYYNGTGFTDFLYISRTTNPGRIRLGVPAQGIEYGSSGPRDFSGSGTPEGNVSAPVGSTYRRTDAGIGTSLYVKESGTSSTGWVPHQRIITGSGTTGASGLSVSFGVTYASAPQVMATLKSYTSNAQLLVSSITTTGCTIVAYNISTGSNLSGVSVGWAAIG